MYVIVYHGRLNMESAGLVKTAAGCTRFFSTEAEAAEKAEQMAADWPSHRYYVEHILLAETLTIPAADVLEEAS